MTKVVPVVLESVEIGRRARVIRRRRGLSLDVVAGLAGITKGYLSMLEKGLRGFHRRGLIEDLARALGCSVTDLTGQPYLPVDRDTADALVAVPGIQVALHKNLACALVQDGPDRDAEAIRHLDTADRLSPQRLRMDPIARDLLSDLNQRARRRVWELDSLCNRFGIGGQGSARAR